VGSITGFVGEGSRIVLVLDGSNFDPGVPAEADGERSLWEGCTSMAAEGVRLVGGVAVGVGLVTPGGVA